ncbi:MAG: hypothetical protein H7A09_08285 [Oceanospirillaceae bacterium]|nr:hypothetical protein [Oceanospirillaceae bacterium]MCP5350184.1 hypothetical protein [Oceanospirillaceae bacterium]
MKWLLSLISLVLIQHCFAQQYADGYYTDDITRAVKEAREKSHHYDYSSNYRYKRTTAQSIDIKRMDYQEMDSTLVEGAIASSAAGKVDPDDDSAVLKQHSELRAADEDKQLTRNNRVNEAQAQQFGHYTHSTGNAVTPNGILSSGSIYSETTLTSTPRP